MRKKKRKNNVKDRKSIFLVAYCKIIKTDRDISHTIQEDPLQNIATLFMFFRKILHILVIHCSIRKRHGESCKKHGFFRIITNKKPFIVFPFWQTTKKGERETECVSATLPEAGRAFWLRPAKSTAHSSLIVSSKLFYRKDRWQVFLFSSKKLLFSSKKDLFPKGINSDFSPDWHGTGSFFADDPLKGRVKVGRAVTPARLHNISYIEGQPL